MPVCSKMSYSEINNVNTMSFKMKNDPLKYYLDVINK